MIEGNYIFSGMGHATGNYKVPNSQIEKACSNGLLTGFNSELVSHSKNYHKYKEQHPEATPFDYFVGYKMGFAERRHVTPWPPKEHNQSIAPNSLDLAVEAVQKALVDAGIVADDIDGWIASTVSPQEQAPGIAATLKSYFTSPDNQAPAMTLTSGCAGFNKSLRRALDHFKANENIKHILIVHTETMSHFLNDKTDFVFHSTFGDAASAAVVSRVDSETREGVLSIANYQDLKMIDFVGVDKEWNLYMNGSMVKNRAVPDIVDASREVLQKSGWTLDDVDLVVPHQTGNAILHSVAQELQLPLSKLYQDVQINYGNVSGTTIPLSLSLLLEQGKIKPGMKILCPTAGVGGEFGAFTYLVPQKRNKEYQHFNLLNNRSLIVLFAANKLGVEIVNKLNNVNVDLYIHINDDNLYSAQIEDVAKDKTNITIINSKVDGVESANELLKKIENYKLDYLINIAFANSFDVSEANVFERVQLPLEIISRKTLKNISKSIVYLSHPIESVDLDEVNPISSALSAIHGLHGSMAGEALSKGVRTVWFIPALYNEVAELHDLKTKLLCMKTINQDREYNNVGDLAVKLLKSLYLLKVSNTSDNYHGVMVFRKQQCAFR